MTGSSITNSSRTGPRIIAVPERWPPPGLQAELEAQLAAAQQDFDAVAPQIRRRNTIADEIIRSCEADSTKSAVLDATTGALYALTAAQWRSDACRERFITNLVGWPMQAAERDYPIFLHTGGIERLVAVGEIDNTSDRPVTVGVAQSQPRSARAWAMEPANRERFALEVGEKLGARYDRAKVATAMREHWIKQGWHPPKASAWVQYMYSGDN